MVDLLSGGVMRGLVGAAASMKTAEVCMSVYSAAKANKDEETMKRALGYASDNMSNAIDSTEESRNALKENAEAAREEEKAEQAARLEKAHQEAAEKRAEAHAYEEGANKTGAPTDIVEISLEAATALKNEQSGMEGTTDNITAKPEMQKENLIITKQVIRNTQDTHPKIDSGDTEKVKHTKFDTKV